jgi:hypothetical protein
MAERAARKYGGEPRVDEFYVNMERPAPRGMSIERAKELGHDGAVFGEGSGKSEFVVFGEGSIRAANAPRTVPSAYAPLALEQRIQELEPYPFYILERKHKNKNTFLS